MTISLIGTLSEEFCEPVDCGIEIYYSEQLQKGCAPVYFQDSEGNQNCCPIGWECRKSLTRNPLIQLILFTTFISYS